jgi:hypothetical protein
MREKRTSSGNMDSTPLGPGGAKACARAADPKLGTFKADGLGLIRVASMRGVIPRNLTFAI